MEDPGSGEERIRIILTKAAKDRLDRINDRRAARILIEFLDWGRNPERPTVPKGHYGIHWLQDSRGRKVIGLVLDRRGNDQIVVIDFTGDLGRRRRQVHWHLLAAATVLAAAIILIVWAICL